MLGAMLLVPQLWQVDHLAAGAGGEVERAPAEHGRARLGSDNRPDLKRPRQPQLRRAYRRHLRRQRHHLQRLHR